LVQEGYARVDVIDNGLGIPAENLDRVFARGFTTKKNGHGFGLHSSALAARDLGGSLTAQSEGPGRGAIFTVKIPLAPGARKESAHADQ
jgi:signal transduction histidine kinase